MQSFEGTLRTFWKQFQVAVNSLFTLPKCFHGLRLHSPTFLCVSAANRCCIMWFPLSHPEEKKAICFRESDHVELAELKSSFWWELEARFYLAAHLCKLFLLLSFFCIHSMDNSTLINLWQNSHPDSMLLREKD